MPLYRNRMFFKTISDVEMLLNGTNHVCVTIFKHFLFPPGYIMWARRAHITSLKQGAA